MQVIGARVRTVQASPSPPPSPSEAHSLLLSPFLRAFPAQIGSLLGVSSTGEVPGNLMLELGEASEQPLLCHGLVLCARGVGAGKGLEKATEEGGSREFYSHEE